MDITTHIGKFNLNTPFINARGCWCPENQELDDLLNSNAGAVVTKTITLNPRIGNKKPEYYDNNNLSVNSMGLPNMGYEYYKHFLINYILKMIKLQIKNLFFLVYLQ